MTSNFKSGHSNVNGLSMYYEIYGQGKPLTLIHGGGSTIQTTFENIIPLFSKTRQIIAMDLQAHGRTADRATPLSFKQDADDVATLLKNLNINNSDFLGFSNGGHTIIEIALRHPNLVRKLIIASSFYKRSACVPEFWDGFNTATIDIMPPALKEGFFKVNKDENAFRNMFYRDVERMKNFKDWTDKEIRSIEAPTLIMNGNHDVGNIEHAVEMYHTFPNSQLVILPGSHGTYIGAIESLENGKWDQMYVTEIINNFLNE